MHGRRDPWAEWDSFYFYDEFLGAESNTSRLVSWAPYPNGFQRRVPSCVVWVCAKQALPGAEPCKLTYKIRYTRAIAKRRR